MLEAGDYTVSVRRNVRQSVAEEQLPLAERKVLRYDDKTGAPIQNLFSDVNGEITYFPAQSGGDLSARPHDQANRRRAQRGYGARAENGGHRAHHGRGI